MIYPRRCKHSIPDGQHGLICALTGVAVDGHCGAPAETELVPDPLRALFCVPRASLAYLMGEREGIKNLSRLDLDAMLRTAEGIAERVQGGLLSLHLPADALPANHRRRTAVYLTAIAKREKKARKAAAPHISKLKAHVKKARLTAQRLKDSAAAARERVLAEPVIW